MTYHRVLLCAFPEDTPYSFETDWWSLGIVLFESFYGETPFYAESLMETYFKIMNHKIHFMVSDRRLNFCFLLIISLVSQFPVNAKVTDEAKNLISNLITDRHSRYRSIDQFKSHLWFTGIDWENIRYQDPPYQPKFSGPEDTSNFDISDIKPMNNQITSMTTNKDPNIELSFVGFTTTFTAASTPEIGGEPQELLQNTIEALDMDPGVCDQSSPDITDENRDEVVEMLEVRLKAAQQEWSEMSHLLTEMKKEKNTLSNKLRVKEEELDEQIEKNSQLRQQLRNFEKTKRQHLEEIANLQSELDTQKILRKQGEFLLCGQYLN